MAGDKERQGKEAICPINKEWQSIFNTVTDGITIHDRDFNIVCLNQSAQEMLGLDSLDPQSLTKCFQCYHGTDKPPADCPVCQILKTGLPATTEVFEPFLNKYLEIRAIPRFGDDEQPAGLISVVKDITYLTRVQKALQESLGLYHSLFENLLNGFAYCRMLFEQGEPQDFIYLIVNNTFKSLTGLNNVVGKKASQVTPGIQASDAWLFEVCGRVALSGKPEKLERYFEALKMWVSVSVYSPEKEHFVVIFDTITERKLAEQVLRASEEKYRSLAAAADWSFVVDRNCRYLYANENYLNNFGQLKDSVLGRRYDEFHDEERTQAFVDAVNYVFATGNVYKGENIGTRTGLYLHQKLSPIRNADGSISAVTVISTDITERKRAEEERYKLETQLRQAQKMESVGRLAGGVAHDFNNMLGVIIGRTELALGRVDPSDPLHADLTEIRKAAAHSAELTRQLLGFARKQTVVPQVLDLNDTVTGMLKMLQRLMGENISLTWQPGMDIWPVSMDPSQIDQVLANLCVNARDAITGIGTITIETENSCLSEDRSIAHLGLAPGEYVLLTVSDSGCGMDQETLSHLFEPFFTTKGIGKGTGLGLATVYGIIKQNNGFINVLSEPDRGTAFKIYLPRHRGEVKQKPAEKRKASPARGKETVLVVEDEPALLDLSKIVLEGRGYQVLAAGTPSEALRLAEEYVGKIDLLMTDVVLPEMNGGDLAKQMLPLYPGMKRLFMSGYTDDIIANHGVLDDGLFFIQKPFSIQDLTAKVRAVLDQK